MSKKKIYERGDYYLAFDTNQNGTLRSKNLYIFYYDREERRSRSYSTCTSDIQLAKEELDRFYEEREKSHKFCPTCGQAFSGELPPLVATAIAEYLEKTDYEAANARLGHVLAFLEDEGLEDARCDEINDAWIKKFRKWAAGVDIVSPTGKKRKRSPTTIAASVSMLRTAINRAFENRKLLHRAVIKVKKSEIEGKTPWFRASEGQIIAMFRYALVLDAPEDASLKQIAKWKRERKNLLSYLRLGVATWARPDALMDFSTSSDAEQWNSQNGYINLNPAGREQSDKYRPLIRAPRQIVPLLNANEGKWVKVASIRTAFRQMTKTLEFPSERGQSGVKLIRRSVSNLLRPRLEKAGSWQTQGPLMLGHVRKKESDKYATPYHEDYLGDVLRLTEELIDCIEASAPGAFSLD
ncbi:phage integrase SAM-like domain-containing protein [Aurantiacibacter suaedae]|uniref:phage integrase SAM-like domain-containing protein n=1 Tax=Aurantiacibacter suaedae TaxID=2545755 RepID=UPI0010F751A0|nr:phage integrase SAM-like domain-containing protein [Aurantiacibacter suaedae]